MTFKVRYLIAPLVIITAVGSAGAHVFRVVSGGKQADAPQSFVSINLDNSTFIPNGSTAVTVGNLAITMNPTSPPAAPALLALAGTNAALFQLTSPVLPSAVQAKAATCASPPQTYSIQIVATEPGIANSPFTSSAISISCSSGSSGPLSTTVALANDSSSATTAGTPSPVFGHIFKDGDLCSGAAPIFKISGVTQPFSASPANARRYWPSGCLMFASFMLRPTVSVAGNGSVSVAITGGGSWPSASSRTTTELYAQNLVFNAPAATVTTIPDATVQVKATLGSWLKNDANNMAQAVSLDGDAGKCWRVKTAMAPTQGGAADVTMRFNHYACGLNNASGTLGGFRWLGQMRNPVYDGAGPPKAHWFASPDNTTPTNGVNWTVCGGVGGCVAPAGAVSGATPIYTPYQTLAASVVAGGGHCGTETQILRSPSSNGFYTGASGYNMVPVYNTTTSQAYFAAVINGTDFELSNGASGPCGTFGLGGSPVAGTYAPAIFIDAFNRVSVATKDAKYNFFRGTGTIAAESTLRVKINQTYWQSTKVFFPFDLRYQGVNNADACGATPACVGTVPEVAAGAGAAWTYDWAPYSIGRADVSQNDAGDHPDIGFLMLNGYADFYNQSALSDKVVRIDGLGAGMYMHDMKDGATDNINTIQYYPGGGTNPWPGLPNHNPQVCWSGTGGGSEVNFGTWNWPTNGIQQPISIQISFDHKAGFSLPWVYARTGELQYLDEMVDQAIETWSTLCGDRVATPDLDNPTATNWTGSTGAEQPRYVAWAGNREVQFAALFYPFDPNNPTNTSFEGTQLGYYLNWTADSSASYPIDQFTTQCAAVYGAACAYVTAASRWSINKGTVLQRDGPLWEDAYVIGTQIIAAIRHLGDSAVAGNKARQHVTQFATRLKYEGDHEGYFHLYAYYQKYGGWVDGCCPHLASFYYSDDDHYAISQKGVGCQIGWTNSGTRRFNFNFGNCNATTSTWVPANCDVIMNYGLGGPHPGGMVDDTPYYITQLTGSGVGNTFNLTTDKATCAGAPSSVVNTTDSNPTGDFSWDYRVQLANSPTVGWPYDINYVWALRSLSGWIKAMGLDSGGAAAGVVADANFRLVNTTSQGCPCDVNYDARYYTQDHFGP